MDEIIAFMMIFGGFMICLFYWGYNSGEKSVKTDLPKREEELKNQQTKLELDKKNYEEKVRNFQRDAYEINRKLAQLEKVIHEKEQQKSQELSRREKLIDAREIQLQKGEEFLEKSKEEICSSSAWLAKIYADIDAQKAQWVSEKLANKVHPAYVAAEKVKEFGQLRRQAILSAKTAQYQLDYLLSIFPWLEDYLELRPEEAIELLSDVPVSNDEYTAVREWLSPDEYDSLSETEKWQLALDRYNNRKKSKWQIGIEYERYIGYLLEKRGYIVHYNGATEGVEDMGRDLIAENDTNYLIVQCKRWAREKVIHEKHIFQLYGTTVLQRLNHGTDKKIMGVFVTTADVSNIAVECADYLGIQIFTEIPYKDYPQIKCNYSKSGERIYHLPFDQQYDRTLIRPYSSDFYALTVQEAVSKGFRHAFRWRGEQ